MHLGEVILHLLNDELLSDDHFLLNFILFFLDYAFKERFQAESVLVSSDTLEVNYSAVFSDKLQWCLSLFRRIGFFTSSIIGVS